MEVVLMVAGLLLVAAGAALWSIPVGLVVLGVDCLAAAYVTAYLKARV